MSQLRASDLLVLPGAGEKSGTHLAIKIRSGLLGGDFSVMEGIIKPHELLAPHTHQYEDQAVIVLSGTLTFEVGGDDGVCFEAPSGSYVVKPRGVAHAFWNSGDEPARYVELSGRDGFERFIDSTTQRGAAQAAQDAKSELGTEFHYDRIPELMRKHQLTHLAAVEVPWAQLFAAASPPPYAPPLLPSSTMDPGGAPSPPPQDAP
jgi:quercetin dioxygenase-like cupin family protein